MRPPRWAVMGPRVLSRGGKAADRGQQWSLVRDRWFWLAGSLWLLSLLMASWVAVVDPLSLGMLVFATVGGLVAWLRPRNPIGWLLIADGLVWLGGGAAARSVMVSGPLHQGAVAAAAFYDLAGWVVAVGLVPLTLLVFPSGRVFSRRWRIVGWVTVAGGGLLGLANLLTPGPLPSWPEIANPFGVEAAGSLALAVAPVAELVFFLGFGGALLSVIVRFRRSSGLERQQLRWLAFAAVLVAISLTVGNVVEALGLPGAWVFYVIPLFTVPVAVGIAVLRYRLWDLDLLVGRTLTYGLLALTIAAIYVGVVAGLGALVGGGTEGDVSLAVLATAIAAAVFQPAREAAQTGVRRLLFRVPDDAAQVPVQVRTLGGFRVERAGQPVSTSEWQSKKARQLLKMLVARRGRPVHREQLIEALWPDEAAGNLGNRLAVAVSTARSVLDPDKAYPNDCFVKGDADTLRLDLDRLWVDVERFLATAKVGLRTRGPELEEAEAMYRGDFLEEDLYRDWSLPLREEARAMYLAVLRARAEAQQKLGVDAAVAAHLKILEVDPWDEAAYLAIVSALTAAGRHGEAQRTYRRYRARMEEVGVTPTPI